MGVRSFALHTRGRRRFRFFINFNSTFTITCCGWISWNSSVSVTYYQEEVRFSDMLVVTHWNPLFIYYSVDSWCHQLVQKFQVVSAFIASHIIFQKAIKSYRKFIPAFSLSLKCQSCLFFMVCFAISVHVNLLHLHMNFTTTESVPLRRYSPITSSINIKERAPVTN